MSTRGRSLVFHGAFNKKGDAVRKEKTRPGSFIRAVKIFGRKRFLVADDPGKENVIRLR